MPRLSIIAAFLAALVLSNPLAASEVSEQLQGRVEQLLFTGELSCEGEAIASRELLPEIYAQAGFEPLWSFARTDELLRLLETAPQEGLLTQDYHYDVLQALLAAQRASPDPLGRANLDILATDALIRFGYHQRFGKVNPTEFDPNANFRRELWPDRDPATAVIALARARQPLDVLVRDFFPRGDYYQRLRAHLMRYQQIEMSGGWPEVTPGPTLRAGDSDLRVIELRRRLAVTGDLPAGTEVSAPDYDEPVQAAVMNFQVRHQLTGDGIAGTQTVAAMNVPVQTRIDQMRMSLERLRWIAQETPGEFVAVNIAGFRIFLFRGGQIVWSARAQVGKPYRMTPTFRGEIQYLELNPTWTVPPTILRNDILPTIRKDPAYLVDRNISVIDSNGSTVDPFSVAWSAYTSGVPYTLRQEPGPQNALGRIKFIFPNEHFVFIHDTPSRGLFDRAERAFSSGCIRIEKPLELAELLLDDPDTWSLADLQAAVDSKQTRRVNLKTPEPVLILYLTASLDLDGDIRFAKDIYGRDARLLAALDGPVQLELPASIAGAERLQPN